MQVIITCPNVFGLINSGSNKVLFCLSFLKSYSQFTPGGGPSPTKFTFSKNPLYSLDGLVKENGKLVVRYEEVFGVDVKYFEGRVDFVQRAKLKGSAGTNLSGTVEFMVCNEHQCLPPSTQKFSIVLN